MVILNTALIFFIVLESLNVLILYFFPDTKKGNGVGVFNHWTELKSDKAAHQFVRYLVNWVANAKLIFILLLIVILFFGDETIKLSALVVMTLSIIMYYVRLHPIIKILDHNGFITPKDYARKLIGMIAMIQIVFLASIIMYLVLGS